MSKTKEVKEIEAVKEVKAEKAKGLIATSDFELDGVLYKEDEAVKLPAKYIRDRGFEELRNLDRPKGNSKGMAFSYEYDTGIKEEKRPVMDVKRVILPLEEA